MRGDLHVHSTASDGTLSPSEIVLLAETAGLDVLAIADHDTVSGLAEARQAASASQVVLIAAVELSCTVESLDVHVLGYHIDSDDDALLERLARLKEARLRRAHEVVDRLRSDGFAVSVETVLSHAAGGSVGRSHIARALVTSGYAETVPEAFDRFIGRGRPYYRPKEAQSITEAVALIHSAGGLAIVAHPGIGAVANHLDLLLEAGIDGVEAYHADHSAEQRAAFAAFAESHGLMVSGGSDFHGHEAPNPPLGSVFVPPSALEALVSWPGRV